MFKTKNDVFLSINERKKGEKWLIYAERFKNPEGM